MKIPFEFEEIYSTNQTQVTRNKVPGGWMVNILVNAPHGNAVFTTTFIVDPNHEWSVKDDSKALQA